MANDGRSMEWPLLRLAPWAKQRNSLLRARYPGAVMAGIMGFGLICGLSVAIWASRGDSASTRLSAEGPELGRLLLFMAAVKAAAALGALALVGWRLRYFVRPGLAVGYLAGALAMAAAPGLILSQSFVVAGALLFHGGLLLVLVLGLADRSAGASPTVMGRRGRC